MTVGPVDLIASIINLSHSELNCSIYFSLGRVVNSPLTQIKELKMGPNSALSCTSASLGVCLSGNFWSFQGALVPCCMLKSVLKCIKQPCLQINAHQHVSVATEYFVKVPMFGNWAQYFPFSIVLYFSCLEVKSMSEKCIFH